MPQMSPLLWVFYPYVMVLTMMVFLTTLIKEDGEMSVGEDVVGKKSVSMKW